MTSPEDTATAPPVGGSTTRRPSWSIDDAVPVRTSPEGSSTRTSRPRVVQSSRTRARSPLASASPPEAASAVLGSSLGGLVSLYIGLRHPDRFAQIGSMSGTIDWGTIGADNPTIIDAYLDAPPLGLRIYLDYGGDAGLGCPGDGSDNYCGNVELGDRLRELGWVDEVDLFQRWEPGAPHKGRLADFLAKLGRAAALLPER